MGLTYHHQGADTILRTSAYALLHTQDLQRVRRRPGSSARRAIEAWCDQMHERLTVQGVAHVCQVNEHTGMIQQIWVADPDAILR